MMQLKIEKVKFGLIPCYVVYPIRETGKTVIFYHGWSSKGELQVNRAAFLAVHGYTVFIPDAVNHGERHAELLCPVARRIDRRLACPGRARG